MRLCCELCKLINERLIRLTVIFQVMRWDGSSTEDTELPQFYSNIAEKLLRIKRPTLILTTSQPDSGEYDSKRIPEYHLFKRQLGRQGNMIRTC